MLEDMEARRNIRRERFRNPVLTKDQAIDVMRTLKGVNHARELSRANVE